MIIMMKTAYISPDPIQTTHTHKHTAILNLRNYDFFNYILTNLNTILYTISKKKQTQN